MGSNEKKYVQIKARINNRHEEIALCPFCGRNNIKEQCKHFDRKWSSPYKSSQTNTKLEPDVYYFKN